ncbi:MULTISPECIES: ABC transporter permease [Bacillales]|uniref:ABC transporter permease n=1 Tax=Bacillales TaxID=1385 RepID=UPI0001788106|nr:MULTISPECIES: sugar ABC transporter permease [Paenibacillus]VTR24733.1 sn-glycerol-3-phosphate transport system permease protein ugpA [Actinobacillus pleuropneumoniae]ACX67820.1 binding-protein-dependent transport systems inner membrane component [Paenibacillus sp. Y412MC10]EGG35298.1 ABC transporter, permease protein [Paenibacillus sp. HGF5]ETT61409.1 binding-protein-dependent transport systems inner membrane component [Paenibacillus sp. FSL H8-457]MCM3261923.1 sugar ABC transporter permea
MKAVTKTESSIQPAAKKKKGFWTTFKEQKVLYGMSLPFIVIVFIFSYLPVWGWLMAFQNYKPGKGIFEQKWVGLDHFAALFADDKFYLVLRNTLAMSFMGLIVGFTIPILFAVLLNELRGSVFKRTVQTISYLPHFVSWVVVAGIVTKMLSTDGGAVNQLLMWLGLIDQPIQFMAQGNLFWYIVTGSDIWKEMGWSAIIYLAAITGIDQEQFEAAKVDGASRIRQIWHITLPSIAPTIAILLIMSIGHLISIGFEKQFLLGNPLVVDYSEVLDLYALNYGLGMGRFSFGTAIGMFNSVVSIILLLLANGVFKKFTKQSIM